MSQGIASPSTPTDPARAKELLEELYQLYNIDLLQPLRSCILGIHLVTEFIEHKLNQGVEESTLFESLIAWKTYIRPCCAIQYFNTLQTQNSWLLVKLSDQVCTVCVSNGNVCHSLASLE